MVFASSLRYHARQVNQESEAVPMKQSCKDALKELLQRRLLEERKQRGLSQVAFARLLMLDVRSYIALEHGDFLCSTTTLLRFLFTCSSNPNALLEEMREIIGGSP